MSYPHHHPSFLHAPQRKPRSGLAWSYQLSGQCQGAAVTEHTTMPISKDTDFHDTCTNVTISKI